MSQLPFFSLAQKATNWRAVLRPMNVQNFAPDLGCLEKIPAVVGRPKNGRILRCFSRWFLSGYPAMSVTQKLRAAKKDVFKFSVRLQFLFSELGKKHLTPLTRILPFVVTNAQAFLFWNRRTILKTISLYVERCLVMTYMNQF